MNNTARRGTLPSEYLSLHLVPSTPAPSSSCTTTVRRRSWRSYANWGGKRCRSGRSTNVWRPSPWRKRPWSRSTGLCCCRRTCGTAWRRWSWVRTRLKPHLTRRRPWRRRSKICAGKSCTWFPQFLALPSSATSSVSLSTANERPPSTYTTINKWLYQINPHPLCPTHPPHSYYFIRENLSGVQSHLFISRFKPHHLKFNFSEIA